MATFSEVKSAQGAAISLSSARHFVSEVTISPVISPSAVHGNVRLNGELTLAAEAISSSAVSAPNEPVIHVGGIGSAVSPSAVKGNVRLNGELTITTQSAISASVVSGHWQQSDQVFEPLAAIGSEGAYAQATATFEPLTSEAEEIDDPVARGDGTALFPYMLSSATGVTGGIGLDPSESVFEPMASVGAEGPYAQAEGSFEPMRSFAVYELNEVLGATSLTQPVGTLEASGTHRTGAFEAEQPAGSLTGNFGGIARLTGPVGELTLAATIPIIGRFDEAQPDSTLTGSITAGSVGGATLTQPRATLEAFSGGRLDVVSPGHALAIEATFGGAGGLEISQPRTILTASGSEDNRGWAELEQPAGSLSPTGLVILEQPSAQLAASGGELVEQYTYAAYAVNLSQSATTEFTDYPYRRIVEFNGEYYGVGPQGIFRIEGNKDAGAVIKAVLETGRPDFSESLFKRVTNTYLLINTKDVIHVSPITGDEQTHRIQAIGSDRAGTHTRRVQFGKGLKARNWGVKIEHEGEDRFTLLDIELVGEVLSRKVGG